MAKWNEYGLKTGTSARDEVLILDSDTNTNKRITVGDIQEFANGKMLEKENTTLNTEAKTLIGAINEVDAKNDAQDASLEAIEKKFSGYVKKTDVDSTLSVVGSPADAKAVGDALKNDKEAIEELADKKITKFYASSQGDTHLPDSDKGKIQDMFLYGKSEQAQYKGRNLIQGREVNSTSNGITCKYNGDGTYTVNGTATADVFFIVYGNFADLYKKSTSLKLVGCPSGGSAQSYFLRGYRKDGVPVNSDEYGSGIIINNFEESGSNIAITIRSGVTANNLVFKPMLTTDTTATYADFEPYVGGIPSPSPDYPQEIKAVVNPKVVVSGKPEDESHTEQSATLPYTLYAIPVSTGGNVTIGSQQYVADYVDVERGKLVRKCLTENIKFSNAIIEAKSNEKNIVQVRDVFGKKILGVSNNGKIISDKFIYGINAQLYPPNIYYIAPLLANGTGLRIAMPSGLSLDDIKQINTFCCAILATPEEIDLTPEQVQAYKPLSTNYPVTNIEVSSEQLDGYTVFNYPISMAEGWNYVKQQIGDTRDYIYDMDLQSAEAYVNSEYAVALTELEVM